MKTLGTALPEQIARCRELLKAYEDIGPAGQFGSAMLKADIAEAEAAQASGDVARMIRAHETLKECK